MLNYYWFSANRLNISKMLFFILITFSIVSCQNIREAQIKEFSRKDYSSIYAYVDDIREYYSVPAMAAAHINLNGINELAVCGYRNFVDSVQVTNNDIFCIGSCGKSLTAMLIAKYADNGKLNLNSQLSDIFTELADNTLNNPTIIQLLSHTAGIPPFVNDEDFFSIGNIVDLSEEEITEQRQNFVNWAVDQEAGTTGEFNYSNGGYIILAAIVERITGKSWEEAITEDLLNLLPMESAYFGMPEELSPENVSRHTSRDAKGIPIPLEQDERIIPSIFNPTGIISLTAEDMARYAFENLKGLNGKSQYLDAGTFLMIHTPIIEIDSNLGYSLGWNIYKTANQHISTHSGGDSSVYAIIAINHLKSEAAVFMCNMGDQAAMNAGNAVIRGLLE